MHRLLHNLITFIIIVVIGGTLIWPQESSRLVDRLTGSTLSTRQGISVPTESPTTAVLTTQTITPSVQSVASEGAFSIGNIVEATNDERIAAGLSPLSINVKLNASAKIKTDDMIARQYFEHTSPSGEGVSDLGTKVGYDYVVIGENLALGDFKSADDLLDAWMKSPGHRANILNMNYHEIGVYAVRGTYQGHEVWFAVQHFGTSRAACPAISATLKSSIDSINAELKRRQADIVQKKEVLESPNRPTGGEYQQKVDEFNKLVAEYNTLLVTSQSQVKQYNAQVAAFNTCLLKYQKK